MNAFGKWRLASGLSQSEVARLLGITGARPAMNISRWENGKRTPDTAMIALIEEVTGGEVTLRDFEHQHASLQRAA